jgi:hypothetical protein
MPPAALPGLLEAAEAGDLAALARLYAMAAAYAREGRVMPPELAQFMAAALQDVSRALLTETGPQISQLPRSLARALRATRAGKAGRKPSRKGADYARLLASSVAQRVAGGMAAGEAVALVAERRNRSAKDVEAAWLAHRADLMPEPEKK